MLDKRRKDGVRTYAHAKENRAHAHTLQGVRLNMGAWPPYPGKLNVLGKRVHIGILIIKIIKKQYKCIDKAQ